MLDGSAPFAASHCEENGRTLGRGEPRPFIVRIFESRRVVQGSDLYWPSAGGGVWGIAEKRLLGSVAFTGFAPFVTAVDS